MLLNGFSVSIPETLEILSRPLLDPGDVKAERVRLAGHWFVHWREGQLFHLRLRPGGPNIDGEARTVSGLEVPGLIRSRLEDVMPAMFAKYDPLRLRPFTFTAQRDDNDVFANARKRAGLASDKRLSGFSIIPRFTIHPKIIEIQKGVVQLGLFVEIAMRYEVASDLGDLAQHVDLHGLHIVHRHHREGERQLVGRVRDVDGDVIRLAESFDREEIPVADAKLEGSKEVFARCLSSMLGGRYAKLRDAIDEAEAAYRLGPELNQIVERMGEFFRRKSPIEIAQGVTVTVGDRLRIENRIDATNIHTVRPVEYVFRRSGEQRNVFAWAGLGRFGPYDQSSFAKKSPRILVLFPEQAEGKVEAFIQALRLGHPAMSSYQGGFAKLFGLVNPEFIPCRVRLEQGQVEQSYRTAAEAHLARDTAIDAAIVVLLEEHARLPALANPYVRTKALFLTLGIPTQQIRYPTMTANPKALQYSLQNLTVALYAKLNGTPWTVDQDQAIADEVVIGMGTVELSETRFEKRQRYVGITTVFSGDGTYVLGNTSREYSYEEYFPALRSSMISILREIKERNGWQPGDSVRVVFHAHKPLKRDEVAKIAFECAREVGGEQMLQIAFVTVSHDHPFMLFDPEVEGIEVGERRKGVMAPERGTIARIGAWTRLLATNSGKLIKRPSTPLPKPLLIGLHPNSTFVDLDYLAEQALKFTALSWRSVMPGREPATIIYSERIAELLSRLRDVPDWSPAQLSVKLRYSRWFL